ncbi:MAG: glycosyltransferase family 2 protein [Deltaproteobacteria bacterium]|nr:glycosyltransferase family 2 protein [Deltaproteobacteria bacterium]
MTDTLYSIVVPVYKSEKSLPELYERIDKTFEHIEGDYELILVEDGGGDGSWDVMKSIRQRSDKVKIVRLTRNFGQHNALMCGFSFASGKYVITMDDDLQNPPEEIPKLIDKINASDLDLVCGVPEKKQQSWIRNAGSSVFFWLLSRIFKLDRAFQMSNFRIARKHVVDHIVQIPTPNPSVGPLILNITEKIGSVTVDHEERLHGKTTYTPRKLVAHFLHGILYHSTLPLKWVFFLGIFSILAACALSGYYLALFLLGRIAVPGWITLVLLVLFFSGIIMFSLGIIGEYLLRITQEVYHMPQYLIRDKDI